MYLNKFSSPRKSKWIVWPDSFTVNWRKEEKEKKKSKKSKKNKKSSLKNKKKEMYDPKFYKEFEKDFKDSFYVFDKKDENNVTVCILL